MLVLFETPAGYSLFQINNTKKLKKVENILEMFKDSDTEHAVNSLTKLKEGELPSDLKKFLEKNIISKDIQKTLLCNFLLIF